MLAVSNDSIDDNETLFYFGKQSIRDIKNWIRNDVQDK
jgi:hypothetical protein